MAKYSKLLEFMNYAYFAKTDGCPKCEVNQLTPTHSYLDLLSDYELPRTHRYLTIAQSIHKAIRNGEPRSILIVLKES